jgi:glutamine synthetase
MRLVPDLSAAVLVDQSTGLGWAPLNQFDQELRPMEICSRQVLARVTDSAAAAGISYRISFETEFTLFRPDGQGGWTFAHEGPGYSLRALIDTEAFVAELLAAMEEAGLALSCCILSTRPARWRSRSLRLHLWPPPTGWC